MKGKKMKIYKTIFILTSIIGLSSNSYATWDWCPKGFGVKGTDFCETVRIGTSKKFKSWFSSRK